MDRLTDPLEALALYRNLPAWGETRRRELSALFAPVLDIHEAYGAIISRIVVTLGKKPPQSVQDAVCRDLIADVFDFLQEWTRMLFEGRTHIAYPLARRAFESLCLLYACMQDAEMAERWEKGEAIWNGAVRAKIAELPIGEDREELKDVYKYFSQGSHPNRDLVAERFLGDGNEFVLGAIGHPSLALVAHQCKHLVSLWFWFGATASWIAREAMSGADPAFGRDYLDVAKRAQDLQPWVDAEFNKHLDEHHAENPPRV